MKKRFYIVLLVLALTAALAVPAFADGTGELYVGDTQVTAAVTDVSLGDGKGSYSVTFDEDKNPTVTLNGAAINNAAGPGIQYTGTGTLTVKFTGDNNTIKGTVGINAPTGSISLNVGWDSITGTNGAGISAVKGIEIVGTNKVGGTITGTSSGIRSGSYITITINCKMGAVTGSAGYGIYADSDVTIEEGAVVGKITAKAGHGIWGKNVTVSGKVEAIEIESSVVSSGIEAKEKLQITSPGEVGDIKVNVTSGDGAACGICSSSEAVISGKVGNIEVTGSTYIAYGIYSKNNSVTITGTVGNITVTGSACDAYGIHAGLDISINKNESQEKALGNVSATAAEGQKAYGLYAGGSVAVNPGAKTGAISGGIYAAAGSGSAHGTNVMLGGTIDAISGGIETAGTVSIYGTVTKLDKITAAGDIAISGDVGNTDDEIAYINSTGGKVTIFGTVGEIEGGTVTGDVGTILGHKGVDISGSVGGKIGNIYSETGSITIAGEVTGDIGGIRAPTADVTISGTVSGNIGFIKAGVDVTISGTVGEIKSSSSDGIYAGGNVTISGKIATKSGTVGSISGTNGHGIYAENGSVTITGTVGDIHGAGADKYGIHAPNGKITLGAAGSTTEIGSITGGSDGSYGIYGKTVEINMNLSHVSGIWSADSLTLSEKINSIVNSDGYGIYSGGDITIESTATIGTEAIEPVLSGSRGGIYAGGNLTIESTATVGNITATAGYGISADGSDPEGGVSLKIAGKVGDIIGAANGSGICAPYGSIKITGTVGKIKGAATDAEDDLECIGIGIQAYGNITISGTVGDIIGAANGSGIYAQGSTIQITGTVSSITTGDNGVGIKAQDGSIEISGTVGKITAPGTDGWGILADGAVKIEAGGTVAGIDVGRIGIYSSSGTTIDGQLGPVKAGSTGISAGSVTITGQVTGIQATSNRGISASGKITITGTVGNITGGAAGHGISAGDSGIDLGDSGSTTVIGNISGGDSGLYTTGMVQLDGKLTVGDITGTSGYGIYAGSNMQPVTGATIQVASVTGKEGGISGNADSGAATILAGKWGIIQATGSETDDHAIYSKTGLVVETGAIIDGIKAAGGDGIHSSATFNAMSDSEIVYIDAAGHGIYAGTGINPQGKIGTIKAGKDGIRSEGNNLLISGPVGDITAGEYGIYAGGTSDITITGHKNGTERTDIKAGKTAIYCEAKPVTIYGDWGNIESTGGHGIYSAGNVTISGDVGNISAANGDGIRGGAPGTASGNVTISGTVGKITGTGGHGIIAMGKVTISGTVGSENPAEDFIAIHGTGNDGIYADSDGGGVEISGTVYGHIVGAHSGIMTVYTESDAITITGSIHGDIKGGAIGILAASGGGTVVIDKTANITGDILATGTDTFGGDNYGIYGSAVEINADLPGTVGGICSSRELVLSKKIGAIRNEHGHGISADGGLTVEGTAEIGAISGTGSGIYSHAGNIKIESDTTGAVTGGTYGIYANNGNITISGTVPSVTANGGDGIYAVGDITIESGATLGDITATGGSGIYADGGAITISGTVGNIDASGYHGITGDTITISRNGAVGNIKVGSDFNGICSWNPFGSAQVTIAGTLGDITGGKTGIYVNGGAGSCITVEDTGVVGDIDVTKYGINSNGDITISGTVASVTGGTGGYGIYADGGDITISGVVGDIDVTNDGICALGGDITISGTVGNVKASVGQAITATGAITISGTTGILTADTAHKYRAISGGSTVTITDSALIGNTDPESDTVDIVGSIFANKDVTIAAPLTVSTEENEAVQSMNGRIILQGVMVKSGALNGSQVELVPGSPVVAIPMYYPAVQPASGGTARVTPLAGSEGSKITVTVQPGAGMELKSITATDAAGNPVALTQVGDNRWTFVQPDSKVTVKPVFGEEACICDRFADLDPDAWYHDAVDFVLEQGLMIGESADRFDPDGDLDRAQILTVLWRLEGSPTGYDLPYTDVPAGEWYAEAVAWASAQGLALGHGDGTFGPTDPVTLEQLAAFLHRYVQLKNGGITETSLAAAMAWAESEGLLSGMAGYTTPAAPARRSQIAWLLHGMLK